MERTIVLLREKNHLLEKFYWINEQELINFGVGNFDAVDAFYQARESILAAIASIDQLIGQDTKTAPTAGSAAVTQEMRSEASHILQAKDELVKSILAQDLQILTYIEREKSNIIRELRANSQTKKAVGAYANSERLKQLEQD